MVLQTGTSVLMPTYACTYATIFEMVGNTFECSSDTFCPSMAFTSFTGKKEGDNGYSSYIIKNNIGNNVILSIADKDSNYTKVPERINREIIYKNNNSQYLIESNIHAWRRTVIPSTSRVVIENCNMASKYEFYTKEIDCDFNLQPYIYYLSSGDYFLVPITLPTLDSVGECFKVEYIKKNGDCKTMEIYKEGDSLKISSDSTKDKTLLYWDLNNKLFLIINNEMKQGGLTIEKSSDGSKIIIGLVIGSQGRFNRIKIKYLPTRLKLRLHEGTTQYRPVLETGETGFLFFDTTLKKYIVWNGTEWTNMDGSSLGEQPTQDENR